MVSDSFKPETGEEQQRGDAGDDLRGDERQQGDRADRRGRAATVIRSRPRASIVPSTSEPSAATVAIRRLATSDSSSALLWKKSSYHRVLKPENADSDFSSLKLNSATATIGR